jgi:hypothetical protein
LSENALTPEMIYSLQFASDCREVPFGPYRVSFPYEPIHVKSWLEENGLKPESIAPYYVDSIRRYRLLRKGNPDFIDWDTMNARISSKNYPIGHRCMGDP